MIKLSSVSYSYPYDKAYKKKLALNKINLSVKAGEIALCTGRSGCGKSTLLRVINGLVPYYRKGTLDGTALVNNTNTVEQNPAQLAQIVGSLFQDAEQQFFALNVKDELALALQWRAWSAKEVEKAVVESAEKLGISNILNQTIFGLSEGQKQKVAIAALLASKPKVLVLDEPSANLDPESTLELAKTLMQLKEDNIAVLVADHRLSWLRDIADSVYVLDQGANIAQGDFLILDDPELRKVNGLRQSRVIDPRPTLPLHHSQNETQQNNDNDFKNHSEDCNFFSCYNLDFAYPKAKKVFDSANFNFNKGEVVALIGKNGVGKTTLARLLTGLEKPNKGEFKVQGEIVKSKQLVRHVQAVLQNSSHQLRMNSVEAELEDAAFEKNQSAQIKAEKIRACLKEYGLTTLSTRHPQSLSGGEKQRLAVACASINNPKILILDEPTSGLDGANMQCMAESIKRKSEQGNTVLLITHDLELMQKVCSSQLVLGE